MASREGHCGETEQKKEGKAAVRGNRSLERDAGKPGTKAEPSRGDLLTTGGKTEAPLILAWQ